MCKTWQCVLFGILVFGILTFGPFTFRAVHALLFGQFTIRTIHDSGHLRFGPLTELNICDVYSGFHCSGHSRFGILRFGPFTFRAIYALPKILRTLKIILCGFGLAWFWSCKVFVCGEKSANPIYILFSKPLQFFHKLIERNNLYFKEFQMPSVTYAQVNSYFATISD